MDGLRHFRTVRTASGRHADRSCDSDADQLAHESSGDESGECSQHFSGARHREADSQARGARASGQASSTGSTATAGRNESSNGDK